MSVGGVGGAMSVDRVMALRAQILERNQALKAASQAGANQAAQAAQTQPVAPPTSFADTLESALKGVNEGQQQAARQREVAPHVPSSADAAGLLDSGHRND